MGATLNTGGSAGDIASTAAVVLAMVAGGGLVGRVSVVGMIINYADGISGDVAGTGRPSTVGVVCAGIPAMF